MHGISNFKLLITLNNGVIIVKWWGNGSSIMANWCGKPNLPFGMVYRGNVSWFWGWIESWLVKTPTRTYDRHFRILCTSVWLHIIVYIYRPERHTSICKSTLPYPTLSIYLSVCLSIYLSILMKQYWFMYTYMRTSYILYLHSFNEFVFITYIYI